jgi:DNA-directed RNA polymerase subunit M/transcription elongation factor TFIIS
MITGTIAYFCPNCNDHRFSIIEYFDENYTPTRRRRFLECGRCGVHYNLPKTRTRVLKTAERLRKSATYFQIRALFARKKEIDWKAWNAAFQKIKTDLTAHIHHGLKMEWKQSQIIHGKQMMWVCPKCGYEIE